MINPPPVTARIARQSAKFTFHPNGENLNKVVKHPNLIKVSFEETVTADQIRWELGVLNVHRAALFPDEDGIARFISNEWFDLSKRWDNL